MASTTTTPTTLTQSVNIILANIGEAPVNSVAGSVPQQVSLALNTLTEVSRDVQSKGWWFNQQSGGNYSESANITLYDINVSNDWNTNIPEEAVRYITIRAARIANSRFIGAEELQKFSLNEELVSLAILQQAHVRNSNGVLDFNSFPSELKSLGVDEVMFLQGNVEEKYGTLRLASEVVNQAKTKAETELLTAQELKTDAETTLVTAQELQVDAQTATEGSRKLDIEADTTLKGKQGALVDAQELKTDAETTLITAQELKVDAETATEGSRKLDVEADTTLKGKQGALVDAQELKTDAETATEGSRKLDIEADTTLKGKQGLLIDAQELKTDAETELLTAQELKTDAEKELIDAQELKTDAEAALIADQEALIEQQKLELSEKRTYETNAESAWFQNGGIGITGESGYFSFKDFKEELRMMGIQEGPFNGLPAYKKVELIKDAHQLRANVTTGVSESGATNLKLVNSILRLIGEHKVSNVNENALAVTTYDLMVETNEELQSRGWYFNTTHDYEFTATNQGIISIVNITPEVLNVEINNVRTRMDFNNSNYIYNLEDQSYTTWSGTVKGTIIQRVSLSSVPVKYRQYLEVRVAILLTEMYPKSGVDIQRLPKMEAELRAYFADVDNDNANYSIFDNYDTASRVGINRNYEL